MVNKFYPPWRGGIETIAQLMVEGLSHRFDFTILVCSPGRRRRIETLGRNKIIRAGSMGVVLSMPISVSFINFYRRLAPICDLVHLHEPFPLGVMAALLLGAPRSVVTYHSDIHRQRRIGKIYRPFATRLLNRVDRVMPTSNRLAASSRALNKLNKPLSIVPLGVADMSGRAATGRNITADLVKEKSRRRPIFLSVGRMVGYKGLDVLIKAVEACPQAFFCLIGDGPLKSGLVNQARAANLNDRVYFCGDVPEKDLIALYRLADAFILPSTEPSEAFGLVQAEAMSFGLPVINTDLPTGVVEVCPDGVSGLTVPPGNHRALTRAINRLAEDKSLREELGRAGRRRYLEHYTAKAMVERLAAVYDQVLGLPDRDRGKGRWSS